MEINMDEDEQILENQNKTVLCAEDALDFNFNESDEVIDSNENSLSPCCRCINNFCSLITFTPHQLGKKFTYNQVVPFVHSFRKPLTIEDLILIEGTVLKYAKGFKIDFCSHKNDVVFHINPRLDQNYIARNTWIEGTWGSEESCSVAKSPVQRGKPFQFQIFLLEKEFLVSVNGKHMFCFQHRIPYCEISRIEIFGDMDLSKVVLKGKTISYPLPLRKELIQLDHDLTLPLTHYIRNGLSYFGKVYIEGRIKLLPVSFSINVQSSNQVFPHPKIIYHFNPRYSANSFIVENSWGLRGEGWDKEVRSPMPPALSPGNTFSLSIISTNGYIQAMGSNWDLPQFFHRLNPENGYYIVIQGDIILSSFKVYPDDENGSVF